MIKKPASNFPKILVIVGPTASGKSALSVRLAKKFNGEIISADSRQVYTGLDIGTGKITKKEMRGVPHHLLDVVNPKKQFSVAEYKKLADKSVGNILKKDKVPIICGGTGLYVDSIINGAVIPEVAPNLKLRKLLGKKPTEELFKLLKKLDPRRAKNIDAKNPRRLVRAIEIAKALGKVPDHKTQISKYQPLWIGLTPDKEPLRKKIHARLLARMKTGMVNEAKKLHENGLTWKRMNDLGLEYRYLAKYLNGSITKKEMLVLLEKEIRNYSKRQMTWFKRNKKIKWFSPSDVAKIEKEVKKFINS